MGHLSSQIMIFISNLISVTSHITGCKDTLNIGLFIVFYNIFFFKCCYPYIPPKHIIYLADNNKSRRGIYMFVFDFLMFQQE